MDDNSIELAEILLAAGVDVNVKNYLGETTLHIPVGAGHIELIDLLLKARADVNIKEENREKREEHGLLRYTVLERAAKVARRV